PPRPTLFPYTTLFRSRPRKRVPGRGPEDSRSPSLSCPTIRWRRYARGRFPRQPRLGRVDGCSPGRGPTGTERTGSGTHLGHDPRSEEHTSELQSPYDL